MVCWNGGGTQKVRQSANLRGSQATQSKRAQRKSSTPKGGRDLGPLAQLAGAKVFSKLDANSGFWQIPLSQSSRLLTTFITPMGRYCFNKLPFGISSAPEQDE